MALVPPLLSKPLLASLQHILGGAVMQMQVKVIDKTIKFLVMKIYTSLMAP
jgi:hypothetical protein